MYHSQSEAEDILVSMLQSAMIVMLTQSVYQETMLDMMRADLALLDDLRELEGKPDAE